ncbi:putative rhamnogalacturonan acetylesterase precursor [Plectosphaerella plurivora]|uniref:Rhamnogalacturonan acetylesterase n=1 Tax=Plectosphaerella plurivora TaxID=936078 RepID=A0A9P9A9K6_9PEZI|nr:putative rhamnogalacturonan acetylesterase precursor [Plectosphaerella plurivora]
MKSVFSLIASLSLAASQVTAQTVYFCGDSTMARGNGVIDGWGQHIGKYLTVPTVNRAIGGRSARSFTNEGRFQAVADLVQSGDVVVIEFGHNDGGSPRSNDNGRSNCPGTGTETCISDTTGEIVYTYVFYVIQAARLMLSKGATVILSSQTPRNQWETGTYNGEPSRYVGYQLIAKNALADSRVTFVDHFTAVSKMYLRLGAAGTSELYPVAGDRTHTGPRGADLSAQAWAQAIAQRLNGTTSLADKVRLPVPIVY